MVETQALSPKKKGSSDQIRLFMNQAAEENTTDKMTAAVVQHAGTSSVLDAGHMESRTQASTLRLIYAPYQETLGRLFLALQVIN